MSSRGNSLCREESQGNDSAALVTQPHGIGCEASMRAAASKPDMWGKMDVVATENELSVQHEDVVLGGADIAVNRGQGD